MTTDGDASRPDTPVMSLDPRDPWVTRFKVSLDDCRRSRAGYLKYLAIFGHERGRALVAAWEAEHGPLRAWLRQEDPDRHAKLLAWEAKHGPIPGIAPPRAAAKAKSKPTPVKKRAKAKPPVPDDDDDLDHVDDDDDHDDDDEGSDEDDDEVGRDPDDEDDGDNDDDDDDDDNDEETSMKSNRYDQAQMKMLTTMAVGSGLPLDAFVKQVEARGALTKLERDAGLPQGAAHAVLQESKRIDDAAGELKRRRESQLKAMFPFNPAEWGR